MLWIWQSKHNKTEALTIDPETDERWETKQSGTKVGIGDFPIVPNQTQDQVLSMDTPLYPFQKISGQTYTSKDCINIEKQVNLGLLTLQMGYFCKCFECLNA